MPDDKPHVIQVTNISPNITEDQIKHFLEYIGRVREIKLYPEADGDPNQTKVAYARYDSSEHVDIALHLTNTVMVDRALILVPYPDENIPDEIRALRVAAPMTTVAGMLPPTLEWPSNVVNMICGSGSSQVIHTIDAKLIELGLQQYPNLPSKTDASKIEEIRRTIYVSNLDPAVNAEQLVQFFSQAGEVMFVRMAGDENLPSRNAYVEFANQRAVPTALAYSGVLMNNRHLKVTHSLMTISNKPQTKGQELLSKEIDEAMKKFKDVEHLIHPAAGAGSKSASKRGRSRSRSRERRRHKSKERRRSRERRRSPSPRKPSRRSSRPSTKKEGDETPKTLPSTKDRKRRSRSPRDRKRSKSRDKKKSRSKERRRSRSRDKKRERSRDRRRRSKSRDRSTRDKDRDRHGRSKRSSSKDKDRKRATEVASSSKSKEREMKNGVKVRRDYDAEEKDMSEDAASKKASRENGRKDKPITVEIEEQNGKASDSDSDSNSKNSKNDITLPKGKNPMEELERKADTEAMDMDTGDDSDA